MRYTFSLYLFDVLVKSRITMFNNLVFVEMLLENRQQMVLVLELAMRVQLESHPYYNYKFLSLLELSKYDQHFLQDVLACARFSLIFSCVFSTLEDDHLIWQQLQ